MTISLAQQDKRCFAENSGYSYSYGRMIVLKSKEGLESGFDYIAGKAGKQRDMHLELELTEGEYLIFAELESSSDIAFTLTAYGADSY